MQINRTTSNTPSSRAPWTPQELSYLKGHQHDSVQSNAKSLNRSVSSVRNKMVRLGYITTAPHQPWTKKEEDYLYRYYGRRSAAAIAKHLKRTTIAVKHKAEALGLVVYTEYWTLTLIAHAFQVDTRTVHRWHDKYGMPLSATNHDGNFYYRIKEEEFWPWALTHQNLIQWAQYIPGSLTGEPKELPQLIAMHPLPAKHNVSYKPSDLQRIKNRYYAGDSVELIAEREGRSTGAIRHIIRKKSVG